VIPLNERISSNELQFIIPSILFLLLILGLFIGWKYDFILDIILALLWLASFYYDIIWIITINPSNLYLDSNALDDNILQEVVFIIAIAILTLAFIGNFLIFLNSLYFARRFSTTSPPDSNSTPTSPSPESFFLLWIIHQIYFGLIIICSIGIYQSRSNNQSHSKKLYLWIDLFQRIMLSFNRLDCDI